MTTDRAIRKGDPYQNAAGQTMRAPHDGLVLDCRFCAAELAVELLSRLGWACKRRRGRAETPVVVPIQAGQAERVDGRYAGTTPEGG